MAEGITLKRIIDMDEATELSSSDYALVDSATGGPKKFALGEELSSLKEDLTAVEDDVEDLKDGLLQVSVSGTSLIINGGIPSGEDVSY